MPIFHFDTAMMENAPFSKFTPPWHSHHVCNDIPRVVSPSSMNHSVEVLYQDKVVQSFSCAGAYEALQFPAKAVEEVSKPLAAKLYAFGGPDIDRYHEIWRGMMVYDVHVSKRIPSPVAYKIYMFISGMFDDATETELEYCRLMAECFRDTKSRRGYEDLITTSGRAVGYICFALFLLRRFRGAAGSRAARSRGLPADSPDDRQNVLGLVEAEFGLKVMADESRILGARLLMHCVLRDTILETIHWQVAHERYRAFPRSDMSFVLHEKLRTQEAFDAAMDLCNRIGKRAAKRRNK